MGRELAIAITALDEDGRGLGHVDGLEVHVAGALPGETVRAEVEHQSPHAPRAWAHLVRLEGPPAAERVPPACPGHGRCGGCLLQHLAYPAQLSEKRRSLELALAARPRLAGLSVDDVVASPREIHYRNKAKYVIGARPGGGLVFGSWAPGTHRLVDMAGCQVPEPPIDEVARAAARLAAAAGVEAYDEATREGELRYLVIRANTDGDVLVVLVARSAASRQALTGVARALRADKPAVAGVVLSLNPEPGGAIFSPRGEDILLDGSADLGDQVGEVPLQLSARAFFQVNRAQAARIYDEVARAIAARPGLRAVDLYCGVGGIALTLAARGARVVGVEAQSDAVEAARSSARAAKLGARATFRAADAAHGLPAAAAELGGLDALVVNPPRKGLSRETMAAVRAAAPARLVYVSCDPGSLARDLDELVAAGYRVDSVRPFDLMPGTLQVETVVTLRGPRGPGSARRSRA